MLKTLIGHLMYLYTPLGLILCTIGVLIGGPLVWLGAGVFAFSIITDTITKGIHTSGAPTDKDGNPLGIPAVHNALMYLTLPLFVIMLASLSWRVYQYMAGVPVEVMTFTAFGFSVNYVNGITGLELYGAVLGVALHQGLGIIYGHELAHTKGIGFLISRWIMALSGAAHFCYAHVYNHHLELGRAWLGPQNNKLGGDTDPATSPRGRSIYKHLLVSHIGQSLFGFRTEARRLKRLGKSFLSLSNRWIRGYLMSVPPMMLFIGVGWLGGGLPGAALGLGIILFIWLIANFELEALNYMEHYGLIRVKNQPIEYRHSWDNDNVFTSWAFIEIGRQADHHDRGETHFWELTNVGGAPEGAPNAQIGYYTEFVLALIPPLYHRMMKRKLAIWDRDFASPEEKEIAANINRKVGYEVSLDEIENKSLNVRHVEI